MPKYYTFIPFAPSDYDELETSDSLQFNVRNEIEGGFDLMLYQNSAEVNRVDKTSYLVVVDTLTGVFREECSMQRPSVLINTLEIPSFNYVYIPAFNRYYYVTSITTVSYGLWRVELNCDVLMSFKDKIKALSALIGRQENNYNDYLVDNEIPTENAPQVTTIDIPSSTFTTTKTGAVYCYVMSTISPSNI